MFWKETKCELELTAGTTLSTPSAFVRPDEYPECSNEILFYLTLTFCRVQVMYMYYFLEHKMHSSLHERQDVRQRLRSENTFLLALDGDIDFEPTALLLMVDLMKRDLRVGAACGRIHPTGKGEKS